MKRLRMLIILVVSLVGATSIPGGRPLTVAAGQTDGFAGTWRLNRDRSEDLAGGLPGAEYVVEVAIHQAELTIEEKIRIRGRWQPSQPRLFYLDGRRSTAEVSRPIAGTMELEARRLDPDTAGSNKKNGRAGILELKSTLSGDNRGTPVTLMTREFWELIDGGQALKILRIREIGEKSQQTTLVLERQ